MNNTQVMLPPRALEKTAKTATLNPRTHLNPKSHPPHLSTHHEFMTHEHEMPQQGS